LIRLPLLTGHPSICAQKGRVLRPFCAQILRSQTFQHRAIFVWSFFFELLTSQSWWRTMRRLSKIRIREIRRIDSERAQLMNGLGRLMNAFDYLRRNGSPEHGPAMGLIMELIGPLEHENKALAQQSDDLFRSVVALEEGLQKIIQNQKTDQINNG
jgi:hypothetical protein